MHMTQDNLCQVCLKLCLVLYIIYLYFNYYKIEPNNQKLLELRRWALGERQKLQESHGGKVKKENNQTLLLVVRYRGNVEELNLLYERQWCS